jgi:hypothetical protein
MFQCHDLAGILPKRSRGCRSPTTFVFFTNQTIDADGLGDVGKARQHRTATKREYRVNRLLRTALRQRGAVKRDARCGHDPISLGIRIAFM